MEQTDARGATLVGFSMGGGEVARYMSRHAGRSVTGAVLVSSVLPFRLKTEDNPLGTPQAAFDETALALNTDRPKFLAGFFEKFFGVSVSSQPVSGELLQWARNLALQGSLRATLECVKSFSSTDFRPDLAAFKVPTLIIHGTEDQTVPIDASARLAAAAIADCTLIEYAGAPHGLFATHKQRLTDDLLQFLGKA